MFKFLSDFKTLKTNVFCQDTVVNIVAHTDMLLKNFKKCKYGHWSLGVLPKVPYA